MPTTTYDFAGSTALVTGAAGDFGRAVAVRLATSGAAIALLDLERSRDRLEESASLCAEHAGRGRVQTVTCDVTDAAMVQASIDALVTGVGAPNLVFNNAGYQGVFAGTADYPIDDARLVLDVNVVGVISVMQATARSMRAGKISGSIVNTASMAGVGGAPNMVAYCASKGAVIALTKAAAKDLASDSIRVNAVSPAFIGPGAMWTRQVELQAEAEGPYYSADPDEVARQMIGQVPMQRLGSVDEVAAVVCWLLSDEASYVSGENILVTGGIV